MDSKITAAQQLLRRQPRTACEDANPTKQRSKSSRQPRWRFFLKFG